MSLMIEEIGEVNRNLERLVAESTQELRAREEELRTQNLRFEAALSNMTQGLLLYDSSGRLVICNQRYMEMYGLSADVVKPGLSFRDLVAHRKQTGSFKGDVDQFCAVVANNVTQGKVTHTVVETSDGQAILIL